MDEVGPFQHILLAFITHQTHEGVDDVLHAVGFLHFPILFLPLDVLALEQAEDMLHFGGVASPLLLQVLLVDLGWLPTLISPLFLLLFTVDGVQLIHPLLVGFLPLLLPPLHQVHQQRAQPIGLLLHHSLVQDVQEVDVPRCIQVQKGVVPFVNRFPVNTIIDVPFHDAQILRVGHNVTVELIKGALQMVDKVQQGFEVVESNGAFLSSLPEESADERRDAEPHRDMPHNFLDDHLREELGG